MTAGVVSFLIAHLAFLSRFVLFLLTHSSFVNIWNSYAWRANVVAVLTRTSFFRTGTVSFLLGSFATLTIAMFFSALLGTPTLLAGMRASSFMVALSGAAGAATRVARGP